MSHMERTWNIPLTNTSKPIYDLIDGNIRNVQEKARDKQIVIYGAGVRGRLIAGIMDERGIEGVLFCDRNPLYAGGIINDHNCMAVEELYKEIDKYFIVISPENARGIVEGLEQRGLVEDKNFLCLGGTMYSGFMEELKRTQQNGLLVLGDCDFLACSLLEEEKSSFGEKLRALFNAGIKDEEYKQLAMNAITIGGFYWTYRVNKALGNRAEFVLITMDMRNFNGITSKLPNTQHVDLLLEMEQLAYVNGFHEYICSAKGYADLKRGGENFNKAFGDDEKARKANCNYIKFNYCYRIKEQNIEIEYLCRLLEQIRKDGAEPVLLFMPVNYEMAVKYCPDKFEASYKENKQKLLAIVSRYNPQIIDFNFRLDSNYYPDKDTYDECLSNEGKRIIAKELFAEYTRIRGEKV